MHAIIRPSGPEIVSGAFRDEAGISHPANVLTLWTDEELRAIGVYPVVDDPIPEGQIATGSSLALDGYVVRRSWTLEDAPPPPVPDSVSPLQMRRALLAQGLLDDVQAFVEASPLDVRLAWEYAIQIDRDNELISAAATAIGATDEEVDDLFRLAASL
jgi:hypothetical protein